MVRIVFLIILLIIQLYGLFSSIRNWLKPSISVEAIKQCNGDEAKAVGTGTVLVVAMLYAITFIANARIMPNKVMTMTLLVLAAIEIVLIFPRLIHLGKQYSGTVDEQIEAWLAFRKSYKYVLGFVGNLIETGIICVALYLIFTGGNF